MNEFDFGREADYAWRSPMGPSRTPTWSYEIDEARATKLRRVSRFLAWATAAIGAAGLFGWLLDSEALKAVVPGSATMKVNTAGGLLLAGVALRALQVGVPSTARRLGVALAALVGLDGALALAEYLLGLNFGIDQLLIYDRSPAAGRMAPLTALSFVLASLALLTVDVEIEGYLAGATVAIACLLLAWLRIVAYLFGGTAFIGNPLWATMAVNTATGFVLLAIGVIAARPERGAARLFVSSGVGGAIARRLVPTAIVLPVLFGGGALLAERLGYFDDGYRFAITIIGMTILLVALLLRHGEVEEGIDRVRRQAEERLAHSEQRWRTIADQATDVVARHCLDGTVVFVSQAARTVMGYDPAELIGRNGFEIFLQDDVPDVKNEIAAAVRSGRAHLTRYRLRHKDGRIISLESTFRIVPALEAPDVPEIVTVSRDVTAQVEIERMRKDFIGMLSHDLKDPLGVLKAYLQILDEAPDERERAETIARMDPLVDQCLRIARNMVDAIRIESGSLPIAREPSSLDVIVRDVARRHESGARLKGLSVEFRAGGLPKSPFDPVLVERALDNLLCNAIEFAPAASRIEIETNIEGDQACVRIRDHGPGISKEVRETLFQRFQPKADSYHDSTGLGLFIVLSVAEAHGGTVTYESPPDGGSRFHLHLPLA